MLGGDNGAPKENAWKTECQCHTAHAIGVAYSRSEEVDQARGEVHHARAVLPGHGHKQKRVTPQKGAHTEGGERGKARQGGINVPSPG